MGKDDIAPGQLGQNMRRPHRLQQRLGLFPRRVAVQDVDLDAHLVKSPVTKLYFAEKDFSGPVTGAYKAVPRRLYRIPVTFARL